MQCEGWNGPCENTNAIKYGMNTRYEKETKNNKMLFINNKETPDPNVRILCPECQKLCDEHWREMWAEYYSAVM